MRLTVRILLSFLFACIILSSGLLLQSTTADTVSAVSPIVAIHVSEYTQAHWNQPDWTYASIYRMLEEAFESDGTPYIEVTDSQIESGVLLTGGAPRYPIFFSLASECISDDEADQISSYVAAGGFVYSTASSWTKYQDGTYRSDIALSTEMGLTSKTSPSNSWKTVTTVTRVTDNQLVNHIPKNVEINWALPLTNRTVCSLYNSGPEPHYVWATKTTATNPASVLMTTDGKVMLAIKQYYSGMFIYNSELTPLAGYSLYSPVAYEYKIIKETVELAFKNQNVPLAKLSAWPYHSDSAFVIRHDMDLPEYLEWIADSATAEKNLGVTGQYYIVTGHVRDAENSAEIISLIQEAQTLGAQLGSHNGGLNCTPWNPSLTYDDYEFYHWGPDYAMSKLGNTDGAVYATDSIRASFDDLQSWLGQRPTIWVAPAGQGYLPESYQILDNLGVTTSGEFTTSPYPTFAININNPSVSYSNFVVPFSRWITDAGTVYQSIENMEEYNDVNMQELVDFYYDMGALVSPYSHSSSESKLTREFILDALAKPYMWNTTPTELRQWAIQRNQVSCTEQFQTADKVNTLTVNLSGSVSADTAIEVTLPVDSSTITSLQVKLNDAPTGDYRLTDNKLKIKAGYASKVTVSYSTSTITSGWTQDTQADFKSGTMVGLDADTAPGELTIAPTTSTIFSDDFSNPSSTNSAWIVRSGNWTVNDGYYNITGTPGELATTYTSTGDSWNNYNVEARTRYISGDFSGELSARLNPSDGSRYSFILYPSAPIGPNHAALVKFSSWTDLTGTILDQCNVSTDTLWHNLRMELAGSNIRCYFDGALLFDVSDSSCPSGRIALESFGNSTAQYDWVHVTSTFRSSGMIVSSAFDSGCIYTNWRTISWVASTPPGTSLGFMTRTAATQEGLASAPWSYNYAVSGVTVTSYQNRWIQYGAIFSSSDGQSTPTLYSVTISFADATPPGSVRYRLNLGMSASVGG